MPIPAPQRERLASASRRRDPEAEVELIAFAPPGEKAPALALAIVHHSRAYTAGFDAGVVRSAAEDSRALIDEGARARGTVARVTHGCERQHCDLQWSIGSGAQQMHARTRLWHDGDQLVAVGCTGTDLAAVGACVFPPPPTSATLVDGP